MPTLLILKPHGEGVQARVNRESRLGLEHPFASDGHLANLCVIAEALADPHGVGVIVRYLDAQRGT